MIGALIAVAGSPLLLAESAQPSQGAKLPVIVIAEKISDSAAIDINAYRRSDSNEESDKVLAKHGLQVVQLKSGLLVFDERSVGLHELRLRNWVLDNMLAPDRRKTLTAKVGIDNEVKSLLASIAPTERSAFFASDIAASFNPVAILDVQIGQGPVRSVTEKLLLNGEPPVKPTVNRLKESAQDAQQPSAVGPLRWLPVKLEERFFHVTSALPVARLRHEASEYIEGLVMKEQDDVDIKTSQMFNGLPLGIRRLQEKLKADGKLDYKSLSTEDQRLLSSILIRNSYQESDLTNLVIVGSLCGVMVEARYEMSNGQIVGVGWVFDITPR